jgi:uncharacterized protein GlcG (DUF336 family)
MMRELSRQLVHLVIGAVIILPAGGALGAETSDSANAAIVRKAGVTAEAALLIAQAAVKAIKDMGNEGAVAVVDQAGIPLVVLRTDYGTQQYVEGATDKAWTAVNFKDSTRAVLATIKSNKEDNSQLPFARHALFLMGGVPLKDGPMVVGAVGVAGSPSGDQDDAVAQTAAREFQALLAGK